jgi:hypothetical protein
LRFVEYIIEYAEAHGSSLSNTWQILGVLKNSILILAST